MPMERLREHYPNVLEPWRIVEVAAASGGAATVRHVREQGLEELFVEFLAHARGGAPNVSDAHRTALHQALVGMDAAARESR